MKRRQVRRLDLGELRPATRRGDGTIRADAHLTRCGVFSYLQPDGTIRRELRERDQVHDPESLASFDGVPVTNDHPPEMIDARNATQYAVGALQGTPVPDDDHVRGRLAIYDHAAIEDLARGKNKISMGYVCDLLEEPGEHPTYGPYDARQVNIRGNHCAIVDSARAGSTARVRLDAAERVDWDESQHPRDPHGEFGQAEAASAAAKKSGSVGDHLRAASAHLAAFRAAHASGDERAAGDHAEKMGAHIAAAERAADRRPGAGKATPAAAAEWSRLRAASASKKITSTLAGYVKRDVGADLAASKNRATVSNMASAKSRSASGSPDQDDEASRSERGENDADPADKDESEAKLATEDQGEEKIQAPVTSDDAADDDEEPEPDSDDDEEGEDSDPYADKTYDEGGDPLTAADRHKMATTSFAVPEREALPINDPGHVKAAMARFGQTEFKNPNEKHAAFNRILQRAGHFGINSEGFERAHKTKLDRKDPDMIDSEKKSTKIAALAAERDAASARADAADRALAKAQGEAASLKRDLEAAKAAAAQARRDADDGFAGKVAAKVELLTRAAAAGAKVDPKMSDRDIKLAVIKHVDKTDVPADKHDAYVEALYDGAIARARADATQVARGADAIAQARQVVETGRADAETRTDEDDEAAVARRMRRHVGSMWETSPAPKFAKGSN